METNQTRFGNGRTNVGIWVAEDFLLFVHGKQPAVAEGSCNSALRPHVHPIPVSSALLKIWPYIFMSWAISPPRFQHNVFSHTSAPRHPNVMASSLPLHNQHCLNTLSCPFPEQQPKSVAPFEADNLLYCNHHKRFSRPRRTPTNLTSIAPQPPKITLPVSTYDQLTHSYHSGMLLRSSGVNAPPSPARHTKPFSIFSAVITDMFTLCPVKDTPIISDRPKFAFLNVSV